jgi:predicted DNA-binding transcriptional regulator YafY
MSCRKVQPYGLVVKKEEWYLIAYCEEAEQIRTFKCERIATTQLLDEVYSIPLDFSLERHWKQQEGAFKQACKEEEIYPVMIRADKATIGPLQQLNVIDRIEDEDHLILIVNMYSFESACMNILGMLGQFEIVEPLELREYVKVQLNWLQGIYN